jgi:membrane associated rhomboid family serine protease
MAGGALGGVFGAALRLFPWYREDLVKTPWYDNLPVSESVSVVMFLALCGYLWLSSLKKARE